MYPQFLKLDDCNSFLKDLWQTRPNLELSPEETGQLNKKPKNPCQ